jgi:dienelactone hydrolase
MECSDVGAGTVIEWSTENGKQRGYFVCPEGHVGRVMTGIIIIPDAAGFATPYLRLFADKLCEQGYKVLVPETPYSPITATEECVNSNLFRQWRKTAMKEQPDMIDRTLQAKNVLKNFHEVQRVGVLGLGFGSEAALMFSRDDSQSFDAVAVICPTSLETNEKLMSGVSMTIPTLLITGDRSEFIETTKVTENKLLV